jgi:hypothetical protein
MTMLDTTSSRDRHHHMITVGVIERDLVAAIV